MKFTSSITTGYKRKTQYQNQNIKTLIGILSFKAKNIPSAFGAPRIACSAGPERHATEFYIKHDYINSTLKILIRYFTNVLNVFKIVEFII